MKQTSFALCPTWVYENPELSAGAIRLYLALSRHVDKEGVAWPSRKRLSEIIHCSLSNVTKLLGELEKEGAIVRSRREREDGGSTSNSYWLPREPASLICNPPYSESSRGMRENEHGYTKEVELEPVNDRETPSESLVVQRKSVRPRNRGYDALAEETGADPDAEKGRITKALKEIRGLYERDTGVKLPSLLSAPEQEGLVAAIRLRASRYRERWPEAELTPTALSRNWGRVMTDRPGKASLPAQLADHAMKLREEGR